MCRIMYLEWENHQKASEALKHFFKLGANDPYLQKIAENFGIPGVRNCHNHGWGYIYVSKDMVHHYTQGKFFADDEDGQSRLFDIVNKTQGRFIIMIELRVTDIGHVSAFNSHPFHFISRNGYEGYLFYNGLLDYQKLAELEHIDFENYTTKNGTTLMGISIANALESGKTMREAIEEPKKALQSAYNLMIFYRNNRGEYHSIIQSYISEHLLNDMCVMDHNTLIYRDEGDLFFLSSLPIQEYLSGEFIKMENGETLMRKQDFIHEYYFDGYSC